MVDVLGCQREVVVVATLSEDEAEVGFFKLLPCSRPAVVQVDLNKIFSAVCIQHNTYSLHASFLLQTDFLLVSISMQIAYCS